MDFRVYCEGFRGKLVNMIDSGCVPLTLCDCRQTALAVEAAKHFWRERAGQLKLEYSPGTSYVAAAKNAGLHSTILK